MQNLLFLALHFSCSEHYLNGLYTNASMKQLDCKSFEFWSPTSFSLMLCIEVKLMVYNSNVQIDINLHLQLLVVYSKFREEDPTSCHLKDKWPGFWNFKDKRKQYVCSRSKCWKKGLSLLYRQWRHILPSHVASSHLLW